MSGLCDQPSEGSDREYWRPGLGQPALLRGYGFCFYSVPLSDLRSVHWAFDPIRGPPDASSPLEILNYLVQENDISTRKLGKILGVDHSAAARILKGERAITVEQAKSLGARFRVDPKVFLEL